jgi:hypothetical protein
LCRITQQISSMCCRAKQKTTVDLHRSNKALAKKVDKLLWKTLTGCMLVIFPTAGNLTAICVLVGRELAFVSAATNEAGKTRWPNLLFLGLPYGVHPRRYVHCHSSWLFADAKTIVTWTACVFHWLTIAGADENGGAPVA